MIPAKDGKIYLAGRKGRFNVKLIGITSELLANSHEIPINISQ